MEPNTGRGQDVASSSTKFDKYTPEVQYLLEQTDLPSLAKNVQEGLKDGSIRRDLYEPIKTLFDCLDNCIKPPPRHVILLQWLMLSYGGGEPWNSFVDVVTEAIHHAGGTRTLVRSSNKEKKALLDLLTYCVNTLWSAIRFEYMGGPLFDDNERALRESQRLAEKTPLRVGAKRLVIQAFIARMELQDYISSEERENTRSSELALRNHNGSKQHDNLPMDTIDVGRRRTPRIADLNCVLDVEEMRQPPFTVPEAPSKLSSKEKERETFETPIARYVADAVDAQLEWSSKQWARASQNGISNVPQWSTRMNEANQAFLDNLISGLNVKSKHRHELKPLVVWDSKWEAVSDSEWDSDSTCSTCSGVEDHKTLTSFFPSIFGARFDETWGEPWTSSIGKQNGDTKSSTDKKKDRKDKMEDRSAPTSFFPSIFGARFDEKWGGPYWTSSSRKQKGVTKSSTDKKDRKGKGKASPTVVTEPSGESKDTSEKMDKGKGKLNLAINTELGDNKEPLIGESDRREKDKGNSKAKHATVTDEDSTDEGGSKPSPAIDTELKCKENESSKGANTGETGKQGKTYPGGKETAETTTGGKKKNEDNGKANPTINPEFVMSKASTSASKGSWDYLSDIFSTPSSSPRNELSDDDDFDDVPSIGEMWRNKGHLAYR